MVRHCEFDAHHLRGFGWAQFRRWDAPLAGRQNTRRAAADHSGDWAVVVMARGLAPRVWRHSIGRISTTHGLGVCRLLPRAHADFVEPDPARDFHRSWRSYQRCTLARDPGF